MFNKLFAVCLLVNNFEKSFDFYKNILDLEINSKEGRFANFKLGETELAIFQKDEAVGMFPKKYIRNGGGAVIGFQTQDVKETVEKLKSKGIKIFEGPKKTAWGQTVAYFLDPDNNIWEISEI
ncbi:MAG TPA: VOC family protein [Alphaproteobacteria bacterium]|jgi:catechol 2,3-dioxygenase-like lactoylglutathione lyase family enzyme|nr:VOC family protein [Alphaproteobacteria bacterium]